MSRKNGAGAATILRFAPDGRGRCLYTEAIDLAALGRLRMKRASEVLFNEDLQEWCVYRIGKRSFVFHHPSRQTCLDWERDFFNQQL